jgi:hypothetical protein
VVRRAQPPDLEPLAVVVAMGVGIRIAAYLARLADQLATLDREVDRVPREVPLWVALAVGARVRLVSLRVVAPPLRGAPTVSLALLRRLGDA